MKIKFLFVFILFSFMLAACSQETGTINRNTQPGVSVNNAINTTSHDNNSASLNDAAKLNSNQIRPIPTASATPKSSVPPMVVPTASNAPKLKNYNARGIIKKIDIENNSVTIDHEDIGDYMVGMEMPFPVVGKNILKNFKVGDKISFTLETGVGIERIISIRKN